MISDLDDFKTYNQAMEIGEEVWDVVIRWKFFEKDTVGKQLVKAVDSIASNLSEGLGRYHYRERKNFGYYSRGSLFETKTWLTKARNRKLLEETKFNSLIAKLEIIGKMLNSYINSIGVQEPESNYGSNPAFPNA
jgi:four helix bundle protein